VKVAINYEVQDGPWGGGNRFVANLIRALTARGDSVTACLDDTDIDIVLIIDPRRRNPAVTFSVGAILSYLTRRNPNAIVIHRINECDERKGTRGMNRRLKWANYVADHTVFVAAWMRRDIAVWDGKDDGNSSIILNGADPHTFHSGGHEPWSGAGKLRLVTHHWGGNWMKGFDVYQRIDAMLAEPAWRDRIDFTYIGNLPRGFKFRNAGYRKPLDGTALADALRAHHVYVTASINEPGSNHQNEGALCGLPVLYRESGALPEYCTGYGVSFVPETFEAALTKMIDKYRDYQPMMSGYPHVAARTVNAYIDLFDSLLTRREAIVGQRHLWRKPVARFATHFSG